MAKKFLFLNANGFYEETSGAYEQSDFINTSAGVGDAGKPIVLDAAGLIDSSMINFGAIDHGALSGLADDDHLQYIRVDGTRAFTGDQSMGSNKLTNVADGTNPNDAVNKSQLDSVSAGLDPKESVRAATTADIGGTYNASGGAGGSGSFTNVDLTSIDGISLAIGERLLVKDQADPLQNGIYVVTVAGATGAIERAPDHDGTPASEVSGGNFTFVEQGTISAGYGYVIVGDGVLTLNTDNIVFTQFSTIGALTGGNGIDITSSVISVDFLASGGLKFVGDELAVEPADFAGAGLQDDGADNLEINFASVFTIDAADNLAPQASDYASTANGEGAARIGIEDASGYFTGNSVEDMSNELEAQIGGDTSSTYDFSENNILVDDEAVYASLNRLDLRFGDLASTNTGEGASLVGVEDANGYFTSTNLEGVVNELYEEIQEAGATYTAGTGGVTAGDLVYISANDTVLPLDISSNEFGIGLALSTEAAASPVKVLSNDTILEGVLVGATAGDIYYWDGSTLTTTQPSGGGEQVWRVGLAKNATDLHVEVRFGKKNSP